MKINLISNQLILLANVFSVEASVRMLFFKLEEEYWSILKPLLIHFDYLPEIVRGIGKNGDINTVDINLDTEIIKRLRGK